MCRHPLSPCKWALCSPLFLNLKRPAPSASRPVYRKNEYAETIVRKGASIGANATLVCGNEIGAYALIGAGAVITKPVKPFALVVGNPAKQIGWVSENGHKLKFDSENKAICAETGQVYLLENAEVRRIK